MPNSSLTSLSTTSFISSSVKSFSKKKKKKFRRRVGSNVPYFSLNWLGYIEIDQNTVDPTFLTCVIFGLKEIF